MILKGYLLPGRSLSICLALTFTLWLPISGSESKNQDAGDSSCVATACGPDGVCGCVGPPRASTSKQGRNGKKYGLVSMVGYALLQGRRLRQEDVIQVETLPVRVEEGRPEEELLYLAVLDGHGGDRASRAAGEQLHVQLSAFPLGGQGSIDMAFHEVFLSFDARFCEEAEKHNLTDGSTAVVALLRGKSITLANLGDSRAVIMGVKDERSTKQVDNDGEEEASSPVISDSDSDVDNAGDLAGVWAAPLTVDHKPHLDSEQERVEQAGGFVVHSRGTWRVNGELAVSRAFGNLRLKREGVVSPEPTISRRKVRRGDVAMVLGSDGLWDVLSNREVAEFVVPRMVEAKATGGRKAGDLDDIAEELVQEAYRKKSKDNIAAIIVDLRPLIGDEEGEGMGVVGAGSALGERAESSITGEGGGGRQKAELVQESSAGGLMGFEAATPGTLVGKALTGAPYELEERVSLVRARSILLESAQSPSTTLSAEVANLFDLPMDLAQSQEEATRMEIVAVEGLLQSQPSVEDPEYLVELYIRLASAHETLGDLRTAVHFYEKGITTSREVGLASPAVTLSHSRLGYLYLSLAEPRQAIHHQLQHLLHAERAGDDRAMTIGYEEARAEGSDIPAAWGTPEGLNFSLLSQPASLVVAEEAVRLLGSSEQEERGGAVGARTQRGEGEEEGGEYVEGSGGLFGSLMEMMLMESAEEWAGVEGSGEGAGNAKFPPKKREGGAVARRTPLGGEVESAEKMLDLGGGGAGAGAGRWHGYEMKESIGAGKFGEVWKARRGDRGGDFILKRLFVEKGHSVKLSGLREAHFGKKLQGVPHICRFVESFEEEDENGVQNLWLVFYNEGLALRSFLYEAKVEGGSIRYEISELWKTVRLSVSGQDTTRELLRQLLEGVADCHRRNVTHRDLKPENLIVHIPDHNDPEGDRGLPVLKLADFGSAVDEYSQRHLYGESGPSVLDETLDYAPPEVLFGERQVPFPALRPHSYDMWSVGVIILEVILGTSKVFQIDARTRAVIDHRLRSSTPAVRQQAYLFKAMVAYCIYPPAPFTAGSRGKALISSKCSDDSLQALIRGLDPVGLGLPDLWAVKLLRRLLNWLPETRITAERALQHRYLSVDGAGFTCEKDGTEYEFRDEAEEACARLHAEAAEETCP